MADVMVDRADLKARLDEYLAQVREGDTLVVTDGGDPIACFIPVQRVGRSPVETARLLVDAGLATWGGKTLVDRKPPAELRPGGKTVAEIAEELRD